MEMYVHIFVLGNNKLAVMEPYGEVFEAEKIVVENLNVEITCFNSKALLVKTPSSFYLEYEPITTCTSSIIREKSIIKLIVYNCKHGYIYFRVLV